jgi:hypothetical protein
MITNFSNKTKRKLEELIVASLLSAMFFSLIFIICTKIDIGSFNSSYLYFVSKVDNNELQTLLKSSFEDSKITGYELIKIMDLHEKILEK